MGWDINLKTDKPMTEALVDEMIPHLPKDIQHGFGKQSWGWSLAVDVHLLNPHKLWLSGSYGSNMIGHSAAESFARHLEKRGFKVEVGEIEF